MHVAHVSAQWVPPRERRRRESKQVGFVLSQILLIDDFDALRFVDFVTWLCVVSGHQSCS
jgi:hypothetical protein